MTDFEIKQRIRELEVWFDEYFAKQFQQSQWQDDFEVSEDPYFKDENGQPKIYTSIDELKIFAKIVRDEIRELRNYKEV